MKILLVEDDPRLVRALVKGLSEESHTVDVCLTGFDAVEQATGLPYDVVILDWNLPDLDGLSALREMRRRGVRAGVLMLTARALVDEKVAGLRAGADDYLTKPFDFDELLARLDALHRRSVGATSLLKAGPVVLDGRRRALALGEVEASLTAREYAVAAALFAHPGDVLTRTELLNTVWGPKFDGEPNVVDVYVGYLRRKLAQLGESGVSIAVVRGVGFRLEERHGG